MVKRHKTEEGFTLLELLMVVVVIAILAVLLMPALSRAKGNARRTACLSNLRQIGLVARMYADDHNDTLPAVGHLEFIDLAKRSAALPATLPDHKLFTCPDDQFYYAMPHGTNEYIPAPLHQNPPAYSSYTYNSGNLLPNSRTRQGNLPGIAGRLTSSIREPAKTVLVGDIPAWQGFSWHDPKRIRPPFLWCFDGAQNMMGFVDGHVSYTKIHFNLINGQSSYYDPPPGYGYKWSGD